MRALSGEKKGCAQQPPWVSCSKRGAGRGVAVGTGVGVAVGAGVWVGANGVAVGASVGGGEVSVAGGVAVFGAQADRASAAVSASTVARWARVDVKRFIANPGATCVGIR